MAFLWLEEIFERPKCGKLRQKLYDLMVNSKHESYDDCAQAKCKQCEIPVVFRIEEGHSNHLCVFKWIKPTLEKSDSVILEGEFANSEKSSRPSFTCYSYQKLSEEKFSKNFKKSSDQIINDHGSN